MIGKKITPHTLRHLCVMRMLDAGIDSATIALWLGDASPQSTQPYLHADLATKQRALDRTTTPGTRIARFTPKGDTLAFLESL